MPDITKKQFPLEQCTLYPVRQDTIDSFERYLNQGIMPGGFLTSCLENNLCEAFGRADLDNVNRIHSIVLYMYNYLPSSCWGSPDHIKFWLEGLSDKNNIKEEEPDV